MTFLLPRYGNGTLYSHRTWKYVAKTEVQIFVTVIVSLQTFDKLTKKCLKASFLERFMKERFWLCFKSGRKYQE